MGVDTCFIDTCDAEALLTYNGTPLCGECWELFGYDRADEADEKDKVKSDISRGD